MPLDKLRLQTLKETPKIVVDEGIYFGAACRFAARVTGVELEENGLYLKLHLLGTLNEALLEFHSNQPRLIFRAHCCGPDCNQEEVGDSILHIKKARKLNEGDDEEGWTTNLMKVLPAEEVDELADLRLAAEGEVGGAPRGANPGRAEGKDQVKKKGCRREEKGEAEESKEEKRQESQEVVQGDRGGFRSGGQYGWQYGWLPAQASQPKEIAPPVCWNGAIDPAERTRNKVLRRARRYIRKRAEKSSSSSGSSGSKDSSSDHPNLEEETLFAQASRVRILSDQFPWALCCQAVTQMRGVLMQEIGLEDRRNTLPPVAVSYYREQLQRRATGPSQRELWTLTASIDHLLRGRPACAADLMIQRVKSIEHTLAGAHWSVSQKLEVLGADNQILTAGAEASAAQKELYQETRLKTLTANPGERFSCKGGKGGDRGRGEGRDTKGKGQDRDRDRKGGKHGGNKGDVPKKKEGEK